MMFNNDGDLIPEQNRLVRTQGKSEAQILKESLPPPQECNLYIGINFSKPCYFFRCKCHFC